jgi:hypothetical protein
MGHWGHDGYDQQRLDQRRMSTHQRRRALEALAAILVIAVAVKIKPSELRNVRPELW